MIVAAADGSALGNPGPAGWAWYVSDDRWHAGGWPHGTNNQGELMAVVDLLEQTAGTDEPLKVLCDSQYVINTVTQWIPGWKRRGWRKADGSPVMNLELVKRLDALLAGREVEFEWVRGHAGHELNEAADARARAVATAYQNGWPVPEGPGWGGAASVAMETADDWPTGPMPAVSAPADGPESDEDRVLRFEQSLLDQTVRADDSALLALLHPDIIEVDSTGRVWDRAGVMRALASPAASTMRMSRLIRLERLAPDAILVVYEAESPLRTTVRSSLWVRSDAGIWQTRYHQGTLLRRPGS